MISLILLTTYPVELVCNISDSKAIVEFDESTQSVSQNGVLVPGAVVDRNFIKYSILNRSTGRRFNAKINRIDASMELTVLEPARGKPKKTFLSGRCTRVTSRSF